MTGSHRLDHVGCLPSANLADHDPLGTHAQRVHQQIASAIDLVIQAARLNDGSRRVTSVQEITGMEGETISMQEIFTLERRGVDEEGNVLAEIVPTGIRPRFGDRLKMSGIKLPMSMFDRYSD